MNINVKKHLDNCAFSQRNWRYVLFFEAGETLWKRTPTRNAWTTSEVAAGFGNGKYHGCILGKPCNKGLHFLSIYIYIDRKTCIYIYICILIQGTNISHLIWEMHRFDPTPLCSDITQCWKLITYLLTTCCNPGQ